MPVEIEDSWIPSLLCILSDSIKYNDSLRNSQTIRDVEDIEEWLLQIHQFKDYLEENLKKSQLLYEKNKQYLNK